MKFRFKTSLLILVALLGATSCGKKKDSKLKVTVSNEEPLLVIGPAKSCFTIVYGGVADIPSTEWYAPMGRLILQWSDTTKNVMISRIRIEANDANSGIKYKKEIGALEIESLYAGNDGITDMVIPKAVNSSTPRQIISRGATSIYGACNFMARNFPIDDDMESFTIEATITVTGVASTDNGEDQEVVIAEKRVRLQYN
ncbi:MAG: hypothetical protein AB7H97_07630 [Pseudobdellovibrionaceae bacterium]